MQTVFWNFHSGWSGNSPFVCKRRAQTKGNVKGAWVSTQTRESIWERFFVRLTDEKVVKHPPVGSYIHPIRTYKGAFHTFWTDFHPNFIKNDPTSWSIPPWELKSPETATSVVFSLTFQLVLNPPHPPIHPFIPQTCVSFPLSPK